MLNRSFIIIWGKFNIIKMKKGLLLSDFTTFKIPGQTFIKLLRWFFGKLKTPKSIPRLTDLYHEHYQYESKYPDI